MKPYVKYTLDEVISLRGFPLKEGGYADQVSFSTLGVNLAYQFWFVFFQIIPTFSNSKTVRVDINKPTVVQELKSKC